MLVTLYCDASWLPEHNVGGWAVWLRSEQGRVIRSGTTPDYCTMAFEAELAAVFAGIHLARRHWNDTSKVIVCSDCEQALWLMTGRLSPSRYASSRLMSRIRKESKEIRLVPKWVKGHRVTGGTDAYLNRRVDQMARKAARKAARRRGGRV